MRIRILAIGSRGDVQPYIALGLGLQAAGHHVRAVTLPGFEALARERGLDQVTVAPRRDQPAIIDWLETSGTGVAFWRGLLRVLAPLAREGMLGCWDACRDADLIMVSPIGLFFGYHVADKLGVPLVRGFFTPSTPTRFSVAGPAGPLSAVRGRLRLTSAHLTRRVIWRLLRSLTNAMRREVLGLPPLSVGDPLGELDRQHRPVLYGFSPTVYPRPPDWGEWIHVSGFWFLDRRPDWRPPPALVDFLRSGPPPVFVSFGSMLSREPGRSTALVVEALRRAGRRGVLVRAAGGLAATDVPGSVITVDSVPHDWLFPQVAAVVHHGGAGTTAAGFRAGVPSVVLPQFADQPFWARRVHALGVGPPPIVRRRLSLARLTEAIHVATTDPAIAGRAAALGEQLRSEDGVARAVEIVDHHLAAR